MSFKEFQRHATVSLGVLGGSTGLTAGAPQTMGAVRMVPLLRASVPGDLRIDRRVYGGYGIVSLDGAPEDPNLVYSGYIPQGFIVTYSSDASALSHQQTIFSKKHHKAPVTMHHRLVKGEKTEDEKTSRFRMLPLDLAMDGYLAHQFGGPSILWSDYSDRAQRFGLSPGYEKTYSAACVRGMREALSTFEVHDAQVGVMVFVAEALSTVFVVSHPDDYRTLHTTLLEDFVGDLIARYAFFYSDVPPAASNLEPARVHSLEDLRTEASRVRADWAEYGALLASGLDAARVDVERVRDMGPFTLERFLPQFNPEIECHIGERIVRTDGSLEYLKTFRLSQAQIRRGYLLQKLADASWHVGLAATSLNCSKQDLVQRLVTAGFGFLFNGTLLQGLDKP